MKKSLLGTLALTSMLGVSLFVNVDSASAHGYVESPIARGYQGKLDISEIGYNAAYNLYGAVITNPQSLEAPKGFPEKGPVDGRIASANGGFGQIGDYVLDNQTSDRWKKQEINTGANTFTWRYTAAHKTTKWHYYMTKVGWDQNAPLSRDELELIGTIDHDGSLSTTNQSHTINIPTDRMGYHVILAVWDVDDTQNAFYNVIDVNVNNSVLPTLPTAPTNVRSTNVTRNSATLAWDAQTTAGSYNVYRDGQKVATVDTNQFVDTNLAAGTAYKYEIEAVAISGQTSAKSRAITVTTLASDAQESPTAPSGLHSMGTTTDSVSLMWGASTHSAGIKGYEIYRNGQLVGETTNTSFNDTGLNAATQYSYVVKAISNDGQQSAASNELVITTNAATTPGDYREFTLGSFSSPQLYTQGEVVSYQGQNYVCLVTHNNYGDTTWAPNQAPTLFRLK